MAIPSLAMIPSGYKDGKVYSVLPSNGDGDFTFSRGSSATRVNKDGLIEAMPLGLGSELITNGGFATDSDWLKDTGWTISGGFLNCNTTISNNTRQLISGYSTSKTYSFTYTVTNYVSGGVRVDLGYNTGTTRNANGTYTEQLSFVDSGAFNGYLRIFSDGASDLKIDNVSIKEVSSETPRLDYSDSSCPSLLLEPQSTNLVTYSEDIASNNFSEIGTSIQSDVTTSPDGTINADLNQEDNTNGSHFIYKDFNLSSGQTYTISVFAKSNGVNRNLRFGDGGIGWSSGFNANFDLTNGTTSGGVIESYGNGWYRCSVVGTTNATTSRLIVYNILNTSTSYQGDGSSGVFLFGFQVEQQSYATSYIPTNGAAATRLADVANNSGNSTLINSTEGVLYAEIAALADDGTSRQISISDSSYNNTLLLRYLDLTNTLQGVFRVDGAFKGSCNFTLSNPTDSAKVAYKYKNSDFALWVNGAEVSTSTDSFSISSETLTELSFDRGDGTQNFYGKTKALAVYKEALTDEQLQSLTTI